MSSRFRKYTLQGKSPSKLKPSLTHSNILELVPPQIVFKDIEKNQSYEVTVQIRNLSQQAARIRIVEPKNEDIIIRYTKHPQIAPGLSIMMQVKYECRDLQPITEFLHILNDKGQKMELPIRTYKKESQLLFEPFIDMGFIKCGKQHEEKVQVRNVGKMEGSLEISHQYGSDLTVQPNFLNIPPNLSSFFSIHYKPAEPGIFKGELLLKSKENLIKNKIDLHATTINHARLLIDEKGNQIETIDFGGLLVGEQKVTKVFLVNNSPRKLKYKVNIRKGYFTGSSQFAAVQTPSEIGLEQSERVMFFQPEIGQVEPFKEMEVNLICRTKISYRDRIYTKNYALTGNEEGVIQQMKNAAGFKVETLFEYSALVSIQKDDPMIFQLRASAFCPQIRLSESLFQFGDCVVKNSQELELSVSNKNQISTEISFPKIPSFYVQPQKSIIKPEQSKKFKLIFQPKTVGKFDTTQILLISKIYEIELRCFGISTSASGNKSQIQQSPQQSPQKMTYRSLKSKSIDPITSGRTFSITEKTFVSQMRRSSEEKQQRELQFSAISQNKKMFNDYLVNKRIERVSRYKEAETEKKLSTYRSKLMQKEKKKEESVDDEGLPEGAPLDFQFETGMKATSINNLRMSINQEKYPLYVTKHMGQYSPMINAHTQKYIKSSKQAPRSLYPQVPSSFNHRREVNSELSAEELAIVQISSNTVDFGEVYVKSSTCRYFWVKNGTRKCLSVQLIHRSHELQNSYQKSQIVPSCCQAGFPITFTMDVLGDFRSSAKYIINGKHEYEMSITGKCVPVLVKASEENIKFSYDEKSLSMETEENITLTNPGNSEAVFRFSLPKDQLFKPAVKQGRLAARESITFPITFSAPIVNVARPEHVFSERLIIKVIDGAEIILSCHCTVPNPTYSVKGLSSESTVLCVGHQLQEVIEIKNTCKYPIVFHIVGKVVDINEKLIISADDSRKFKVKYKSEEVGTFDAEVCIQPRCGVPKTLHTGIQVIEPQIEFSAHQLDMGLLIVQGIVGSKHLTLCNRTPIDLPFIIDLRPKSVTDDNPKFIETVSVQLINTDQQLDVVIPTVKSEPDVRHLEGQNLVEMEVNEDQLDMSEDDEEEVVQRNQDEFKRYRLVLKPNKIYDFIIEFAPVEVREYQIRLPFSVEKSKSALNSPVILANAIKPQFIFDPPVIDFKRKIVTKPQRSYAKILEVVVMNLDDEECSWELHDNDIRRQGIFTISANKGTLKPKGRMELRATFNPLAVGEYSFKLPLFLKGKKFPEAIKYVEVIMKGTATLPNLFFNKREVLLPVVPLGIETMSTFKILNDGYENCNLKASWIDDVANLDVQVLFPDGNNIGIARQKLRVDVVWKFPKPMSFCLKLEFIDDLNRSFVIPVSGTTDNCILTNYTYFLRNQSKFTISTAGALQLEEVPQEPATSMVRKNSSHSLRSNVTNRSILSYLGVNPISPAILSNTIDYINRYLNANMLTTPIKEFPGSVIENDGQQIFEVLAFVSSKSINYPWRYHPTPNEKPISRVNKIFHQYNELIKVLKIEGAQLNHIRPEYLLSFNDLNVYLGNLDPQKSKFYIPSLLKINSGLFNYLSLESWITLLYQMFKIYLLTRITVKNHKNHLNIQTTPPPHYMEASNFVSTHETILFHWVEDAILEVLMEERRLTNFDKDFKDGVAIAVLLKKYAGVQILKQMKLTCSLEEQYRENAVVVCEGLASIGLQNHVTPKDICTPLQRQMLMLILHLYVYLPFYVPRQAPIVFKCILGEEVIRSIELTNPSKTKPITYSTRYEGSEDFHLLSDSKFRIPPGEKHTFEVKYVSRVSAEVKGKLMFINVKENSLSAAALVFELRSEITGRVSDRVWNISGLLYEQVEFQIEVFNKFVTAQMTDFTIYFQTEYLFEGKKAKKAKSIPTLPESEQLQTVYTKAQNIKIRKNGTAILPLNFVPTSLYSTKTTILFLNPIIGEFQHEIIGKVEHPTPIAELRPPMTLITQEIVRWDYPIHARNEQVLKAKKTIDMLKKKKTAKDEKHDKMLEHITVDEMFFVDMPPNPFVTTDEQILIAQKTRDDKKTTKESLDQNKIPFTIVCKKPIYQFSTYLLLFNKWKTDVRRYRIIFTVQPKPLKAILEMTTSARSEVTQNLPVVNNTDRDWSIKVTWAPDTQKNGGYFSIPSQYNSTFPVKKMSIGNFPITFKPKWANQAEAKLILNNPLTLDQFEYSVLGHGEEPLAEDHIQIQCEAKQTHRQQIEVKNPYNQRSVAFRIETDLQNCRVGTKLVIPAGSREKLSFEVTPILCGEYTGSITLFEDDGPQYIWYTISVTTNYPQTFKSLSIEAEIRSRKLFQIHLPNEQQIETEYDVLINSRSIHGDSKFTIKPHIDNVYVLEYQAFKVGTEKASICFMNTSVGQILYDMELVCREKQAVIINNLQSPLGVSTKVHVVLENPSAGKTIVKVINSNPDQFVVRSGTVRLDAGEKKEVEIEYVPASLDTVESAKILFTSKDIGDWHYELAGTGQMPIPYNIYTVYNGLFTDHSDTVKFRNPFKYDIVVGVKLAHESDGNIFKLLNHGKTRFQLDANGVLEIPFSFIPNKCRTYNCQIMVLLSEKIFWTFPIVGVTETNTGEVLAHLQTRCRDSAGEFVQVPLTGVELTRSNNEFSFEFENVPANYRQFVEKFLIVECNKSKLKHQKDALDYQFLFKPMKPAKVSFDFLITQKEGSRWRYRVVLEGTHPEVDDIIEIESSLLMTSTISFKLTNIDKSSTQYKARFTSDSAHEFMVQPKEGKLAPFGSKGTNIFVSFTPVEYGKEKRGKLIIETSNMFWSYLLRGSLPKYSPPKNELAKSKLHQRL